MKRYESIERVDFRSNFTDFSFLNYRLQSLKNEFCITNFLYHLLFCNRSPNSNEGQYRLCSQLYVKDAHDFVSSIKHHFSPIFSNNKIFSNEIELLFVKSRNMRFNLDVMYSFDSHFQLVVSKQNCCMNFLVVKQPCDIIVSLSEVYVRIRIVSISNDLLLMSGEYGLSKMCEKRNLFLNGSASFICGFYFDMCKLLRADNFVYMYEKFLPNVDYLAETFKIINKPYLQYYSKKFNK